MSTFAAIAFLRPFAALVMFGLICLPARRAVMRYMRNGKLKRFLLTELKARRSR